MCTIYVPCQEGRDFFNSSHDYFFSRSIIHSDDRGATAIISVANPPCHRHRHCQVYNFGGFIVLFCHQHHDYHRRPHIKLFRDHAEGIKSASTSTSILVLVGILTRRCFVLLRDAHPAFQCLLHCGILAIRVDGQHEHNGVSDPWIGFWLANDNPVALSNQDVGRGRSLFPANVNQ